MSRETRRRLSKSLIPPAIVGKSKGNSFLSKIKRFDQPDGIPIDEGSAQNLLRQLSTMKGGVEQQLQYFQTEVLDTVDLCVYVCLCLCLRGMTVFS
jgi:hypothetical protein